MGKHGTHADESRVLRAVLRKKKKHMGLHTLCEGFGGGWNLLSQLETWVPATTGVQCSIIMGNYERVVILKPVFCIVKIHLLSEDQNCRGGRDTCRSLGLSPCQDTVGNQTSKLWLHNQIASATELSSSWIVGTWLFVSLFAHTQWIQFVKLWEIWLVKLC